MLEALVAATAMTGLFALAKGAKSNERFDVDPPIVVRAETDHREDLPCPWCYAPTDETDNRCRGCGREFG